MQSTLVDSGPLIALFAADDRYHRRVRNFFKANRLRLVTTWPVITEVSALLPQNAAFDFLEWIVRGGLQIAELTDVDIGEMLALLRKYADLPMDLADASLVALALRSGRDTVVSLDSDFAIYRLSGKRTFRNLLTAAR